MIGAALVSLRIFCILRGDRARFVTLIALALPTMGEAHPLLATLRAGHYMPGTVTAFPSVICGLLFLRALVKEYGLRQADDRPAILEPTVALQRGSNLSLAPAQLLWIDSDPVPDDFFGN
jgi:hypothetical protein